MEIFRALNPDQERVFAPKVHAEFTTRRLLVTEWVEGVSPDRAALSREVAGELARLGGQSVFQQIVGTGFFHSTRTPVTSDYAGSAHLPCWIGGKFGQITLEMRFLLADLFAGITARNAEKVIRVAERMAFEQSAD